MTGASNWGCEVISWAVAGPPGAGKTTATKGLVAQLGGVRVFNVWRASQNLLASGHPVAKPLRGLAKGRDVFPDEVVRDVFSTWVSREVPMQRLLIDGYPKNPQQVHDLFEESAALGLRLLGLVVFDLPDSEARMRVAQRWECLRCGNSPESGSRICPNCMEPVRRRPDDAPEIADRRILHYRKMIEAVEPAFAARSQVRRIDASRSRLEVVANLAAAWSESVR